MPPWDETTINKLLEEVTATDYWPSGELHDICNNLGQIRFLQNYLQAIPTTSRLRLMEDIHQASPEYCPAMTVLAELYLEDGEHDKAVAMAERSLARSWNDLYTQRVLRKAQKLAKPDLIGRFCRKGYEEVTTTTTGDVFLCCPGWLPISVGNIFEQSWEEIQTGEAMQEIRRSFREGDYKYCSRLSCPFLFNLPKWSPEAETIATRGAPASVHLCHDRSCNLSCPSCRTGVIVANSEEQRHLDRLRDDVVIPLLKEVNSVAITGSGDPFGSRHFQDILRRLNPTDFPKLQVKLQTNGLLFTPAMWKRLPGLHGMVKSLIVSIDAATADTYHIVRRGGSWEKLVANMEWLGEQYQQGEIKGLRINFVVQEQNFREMNEFVQLGKQWGVYRVVFRRIRQWGSFTPDEFAKVNIFSPNHPAHAEFKASLHDPLLADPLVHGIRGILAML